MIILTALLAVSSACKGSAGVQESLIASTDPTTAAAARFAGGAKAVKINTSTLTLTGSFTAPTTLPVSTPVPSPFPGYSSTAVYLPGVPATRFFDVDGTTITSKPAWLYDFQLGITSTTPSAACATFGGSGNADVASYYRVSEADCGSVTPGVTSNLDPVFMRVVLNRNSTVIGTAENLMVQIEYQASGLRLNSDGDSADSNPENSLDQLWKVFWNTSLSSGSAANVFSIFVPPNYANCLSSGTGAAGGAAGGPGACLTGYRGAPITVKQMIIPLSAYPTMSVIQFSRRNGRINNAGTFTSTGNTLNYVTPFLAPTADCVSDSPLCLGLVIRSILLMRI